MKKLSVREIALSSMFIALIAIGAFIVIPIPNMQFTLQFLFTMLAGLLLGPKLGFISVAVYLLIGLSGIPIFSEGGGPGYIFMPSFGYLIGFAVGTYFGAKIAHIDSNPSFKRLLAANFVNLAIVYTFGMVHYYFIKNFYMANPFSVWQVFLYCFILAVPGDTVLCFIGAGLGKRLIPILRKNY